jgi:hypothetical protein
VVDIEAPVHELDVTKRIMESFSVSRAGSRITEQIGNAIKYGQRTGLFHCSAGFLYADNNREAKVRSRSSLESVERKIELIAPEELDAALLEVIRTSFSISQEDAISGALDMLGFGRASSNIAAKLTERIDTLLRTGRIKRDEEKLVAA